MAQETRGIAHGDVSVDVEAASAAMRDIAQQARDVQQAHARTVPSFPAHAAGKGFAAFAQRLQQQCERLHQQGTARFEALASTADAARAQFGIVGAADEESARALKNIEGGMN